MTPDCSPKDTPCFYLNLSYNLLQICLNRLTSFQLPLKMSCASKTRSKRNHTVFWNPPAWAHLVVTDPAFTPTPALVYLPLSLWDSWGSTRICRWACITLAVAFAYCSSGICTRSLPGLSWSKPMAQLILLLRKHTVLICICACGHDFWNVWKALNSLFELSKDRIK